MLVGVDDSRRRVIRFAQRFGQEALCHMELACLSSSAFKALSFSARLKSSQ
jgi:hypothetical protein